MIEDINFANHMYTKISDLKINKYNKNLDLDYLYYEEPKKKIKNKKIKKIKNKGRRRSSRMR
jgi:hypothetical protein